MDVVEFRGEDPLVFGVVDFESVVWRDTFQLVGFAVRGLIFWCNMRKATGDREHTTAVEWRLNRYRLHLHWDVG
jgi:hypothetical protein